MTKRVMHGKSKTRAYNSWTAMKQRCDNKGHISYNVYGGRGISICEEWYCFKTFLKDMGERPEGTSIDRIDNNKGYSKENCVWSSNKDQMNNRNCNRLVTYKNKTKTLAQWAECLGISPSGLARRIKTMSDPDDIFKKGVYIKIELKGESLTIKEWANKTKIKEQLIRQRLSRGWEIEDVLRKKLNKQRGAND